MPSVLIVDDSLTIRKMIMAALRPLNLNYGEASSGLEAIEQLVIRPYDLITLDLNMPDMHGLEFLQFVRSHSGLKDVPVLVITTRNDQKIREVVLSAGANQYITKPFTPEELFSAVNAVLNG